MTHLPPSVVTHLYEKPFAAVTSSPWKKPSLPIGWNLDGVVAAGVVGGGVGGAVGGGVGGAAGKVEDWFVLELISRVGNNLR